MKTIKILVTEDGWHGREVNPYPKYDTSNPDAPLNIGWKRFEATVKTYGLTERCEPGSVIDAELISRANIYDFKIDNILKLSHFGELTMCKVIGYSDTANKVRFGYMPGCGTGSFYTTVEEILKNNPSEAYQPIEQSKEEKKDMPNSTSLIESCRKSLQGWKDELKRNGESLGQVNEHSYTTGYMNGYFEASTKN